MMTNLQKRNKKGKKKSVNWEKEEGGEEAAEEVGEKRRDLVFTSHAL